MALIQMMMSTVLELGLAVVWTVYYVLESGVKLVLPARLFYKDIGGQVGGGLVVGLHGLLLDPAGDWGRLWDRQTHVSQVSVSCTCRGGSVPPRFARLGARVVTWDINKVTIV